MKVAHKNAEVIKAWADGKQIQFGTLGGHSWLGWPEKPLGPSYVFAPWHCDGCYKWRVKPEPKTGWLNIYEDSSSRTTVLHPTRKEADDSASRGRTACIEISYEEGQGLT